MKSAFKNVNLSIEFIWVIKRVFWSNFKHVKSAFNYFKIITKHAWLQVKQLVSFSFWIWNCEPN